MNVPPATSEKVEEGGRPQIPTHASGHRKKDVSSLLRLEVGNRLHGRLLKGEEVNWSPLARKDKNAGKHEIYFWSRDKILLDMAGFLSERVDLPGEAGEKNVYGGRQIRLYRITGHVDRSPEEIIRIYDEGLVLLRRRRFLEAAARFFSLTK